MTIEAKYNRLKDEKSAYLVQHKENPVHWYPYGPEALEASRIQNKPIFLSIGYSSCHWCHVMAHESFDDKETADFLNEHFICIKVDKEEHPDLDSYYQLACQLFTNSGGWPLSAFLLPDMRPFFVGTYYPKTAAPGRPNFMEILKELNRAFNTDDKLIQENATKVTEQIEQGVVPQEKVEFKGHYPPPQAILEAVKNFKDTEFGGYGSPPKFPHFSFYDWALEQMLEGMIPKEQGDHIIFSLEKMLFGGIYDHARGGIHRYSVDKEWLLPHFEKMLYDQAGLLKVLSKLGLIYQSPLVFDALNDTLDYPENEMLSEGNYFFSAQDADSEGIEGLYFTFTKEEFEDILNKIDENIDKDKVLSWFELTEEGNFERGLNIISMNYSLKDEIYEKDNWDLIRKIRKSLRQERQERIPPLTDNKGVASWNFMALTALVDVIQYCPIESLVLKATTLFNKALEGVYTSFLTPAPSGNEGNESLRIRQSTTKQDSLPLFENYVTFAELQLRVYEICANSVFKENFIKTLEFIKSEFIIDKEIYTRAKYAQDYELYPNQRISTFDNSYRSPKSLLIGLIRRAKVLFADPEIDTELEDAKEASIHESLKNPISAGEALRSHTYPEEAYKTVKVPKSWLMNKEFSNFMKYFLPRFVFDYSEEENSQQWQICNSQNCELMGEGLKDFIETLTKNQETH